MSSRFTMAALLLMSMAGATAQAAYFQWETVTLPVSSGASCSNGSPYRFFVNRTPFTTRTVVVFEGGGACFGQNTCAARISTHNDPKYGVLLAVNPDGIGTNYMTALLSNAPHTSGSPVGLVNLAALGLVTPFTARMHPLQSVQTQSWNIVYAPYCTGDIGAGNKVVVYDDADPARPLTYYHRGSVNGMAMADWLGRNLPRPDKLFVTGFSAGGYASSINYLWLRQKMNPKQSALLNDAGPLFSAPAGTTPEQSPSLPLYQRVREAWGFDGPQGVLAKIKAAVPNYQAYGLDFDNFGSVLPALARIYPTDRISMATMLEDAVLPRFAYEPFYPDILAAPAGPEREARINKRWRQDIGNWVDYTRSAPANLGYYIPNARDLYLSHTLTVVTFAGTGIADKGQKSVGSFIDNLIDGSGPVPRLKSDVQVTERTFLGELYLNIVGQLLSLIGA